MKNKSIFILSDKMRSMIYSENAIKEISEKTEIVGFFNKDNIFEQNTIFKGVKFLFTGWEGIKVDKKLLNILPDLEVVFYGAGTIKDVQTKEMWEKNIRITSSAYYNAIPVANVTTSLIILAMKNYFRLVRNLRLKKERGYDTLDKISGYNNAKIGILSYSKIGKIVIENILKSNNEIYLYDPYISEDKCKSIGVIKSSLEEIFSNCDVISIHSPLTSETKDMLDMSLLERLKPNATFINTARGGLVVEKDLISILEKRDDVLAILDVTDPIEPPVHDSPLYTMDNVILSPHIAGSQGKEIFALGDNMVRELKNYLENGILMHEISESDLKNMA